MMDETNDLATEVQELAWAMVDEQATDGQIHRLEELLLEDHEARRVYVMCMQMHSDLHYLLGGKQPRLPAAIEEAIKAERKKARPAALPIVDLPPVIANVPFVDRFAS
jgi:hypothetical protein